MRDDKDQPANAPVPTTPTPLAPGSTPESPPLGIILAMRLWKT